MTDPAQLRDGDIDDIDILVGLHGTKPEREIWTRLRTVLAALPTDAVQPVGGEPVAWKWRQLMHDSMGGWEQKVESYPPSKWVKPEDIEGLTPLYATAPTAGSGWANPVALKATGRGFMRGEFTDRYNAPCSIQESSLAEESCVWLGTEVDRMHLTQDMVRSLLPLLNEFASTGQLPAAPSADKRAEALSELAALDGETMDLPVAVDWERVGPKLVEALETVKAGGSWQGDTASDALAAATPGGK